MTHMHFNQSFIQEVFHVPPGHRETDEKLWGANQTDSVSKNESVFDRQRAILNLSPSENSGEPFQQS